MGWKWVMGGVVCCGVGKNETGKVFGGTVVTYQPSSSRGKPCPRHRGPSSPSWEPVGGTESVPYSESFILRCRRCVCRRFRGAGSRLWKGLAVCVLVWARSASDSGAWGLRAFLAQTSRLPAISLAVVRSSRQTPVIQCLIPPVVATQ